MCCCSQPLCLLITSRLKTSPFRFWMILARFVFPEKWNAARLLYGIVWFVSPDVCELKRSCSALFAWTLPRLHFLPRNSCLGSAPFCSNCRSNAGSNTGERCLDLWREMMGKCFLMGNWSSLEVKLLTPLQLTSPIDFQSLKLPPPCAVLLVFF